MDVPDIETLRTELLERREQKQLAMIARVGEFDYSWICRFTEGKIREPKVSKLVRLRAAVDQIPRAA